MTLGKKQVVRFTRINFNAPVKHFPLFLPKTCVLCKSRFYFETGWRFRNFYYTVNGSTREEHYWHICKECAPTQENALSVIANIKNNIEKMK